MYIHAQISIVLLPIDSRGQAVFSLVFILTNGFSIGFYRQNPTYKFHEVSIPQSLVIYAFSFNL